jgi:hypothetical protein
MAHRIAFNNLPGEPLGIPKHAPGVRPQFPYPTNVPDPTPIQPSITPIPGSNPVEPIQIPPNPEPLEEPPSTS